MSEIDTEALRALAQELREVGGFGLNFARNPNDIERYEAVLAASARLAGLLDGKDAAELLDQYRGNQFSIGPAASGEAAVFRDRKLLLVRRTDDGLWALPGGITDPGETLAQTAWRELHEETGIVGEVAELLGIFDSRLWRSEKKVHFYHAVFLIDAGEQEPRAMPEVSAAGWFAEDELPPLSPGHHLRAPFLWQLLRGEVRRPWFDGV